MHKLLAIFLLLPALALADPFLKWDPPTQADDGATLQAGDIGWYRVYVASKNAAFNIGSPAIEIQSAALGVADPPNYIRVTAVPGLTPGKKVAVTAVGTMYAESGASNALTNIKPKNPTNLRQEDIP
jgi:hypothetical protein